jgi:Tryptophan halogenase
LGAGVHTDFNRIDHLTIVGGGSAGWLAASLLSGLLNRRSQGPDVKITVIESPRIPRVGVGEATTLIFGDTLKHLNIHEKDFLKKCNGTFKTAVKFVDWNRDANGAPCTYFHPFFAPGMVYGQSAAYHYLKRARAGDVPPMAYMLTPGSVYYDDLKAPRGLEGEDYEGFVRYSYHLDATLFADYLKNFAIGMDVEYIADEVVDVTLDSRGFVTELTLEERGVYPVEFVLDCSGFQGLVVRKAMAEPFIPFKEHLLCDRAIAAQVPYLESEQGRIEPFTTSTALSAGWVWKVPLFSRRGMGYVYSSAHTGDDQAMDEFLQFIGGGHQADEMRVIPMEIGRIRRNWVKNCVAIGLSGGFVEPLEATALHFTQMAVHWFAEYFPDKAVSPELADGFNRLTSGLYDEIRDIIALHYHLSNRDDSSFWRAVRHDVPVTETLARRLALWRRKLPGPYEREGPYSIFNEWSYIYILAGKGFFDGIEYPMESALSDDDFQESLDIVDRERPQLRALAPDHAELLRQINAADYTPWHG